VDEVVEAVAGSGLTVRSVNGDIGDLNRPLDRTGRINRERHLDALLSLTGAVGARALVLPCGALATKPLTSLDADLELVAAGLAAAAQSAAGRGTELWTESLHYHRLCWNVLRAQALTDRLDGTGVRMVMDFSHIVASGGDPCEFVDRFGDRIAHVHIRDAVPGNINVSVGRGRVDFARGLKALADAGYAGHFSLELETRDISDHQRPRVTVEAAQLISDLI
jgi:sugar phosphate isomerase/epimerase